MMKHLAAYIATLVAFVAIDMIWLAGIARSTYVAEMGGLLRKQPNLVAAVAFYLIYAAGIWFFAIRASDGQNLGTALLLGAALGLVAYGTYDLTNLSVMEGFGVRIALIDLAWGTFLTSIVSLIGAFVLQKLG